MIETIRKRCKENENQLIENTFNLMTNNNEHIVWIMKNEMFNATQLNVIKCIVVIINLRQSLDLLSSIRNLYHLSKNKFGSNIVEKSIKVSNNNKKNIYYINK